MAICGLAAREQDDDGRASGNGHANGNGKISAEQKQVLVDLQQKASANTKLFLQFYGVETLDDLPARKFAEAKVKLETKIAQNERAKRETQK